MTTPIPAAVADAQAERTRAEIYGFLAVHFALVAFVRMIGGGRGRG